jgi:hypothetical protein
LVGSAWLIAVTLTRVGEVTVGALNRPVELTVPVVADHVTEVFKLLLARDVNC